MDFEYNSHLIKVGDKLMINIPVGIKNWRTVSYGMDNWRVITVDKVMKTQFLCIDKSGNKLRFSFSKYNDTAKSFAGYGDNKISAHSDKPMIETDQSIVADHLEKLNIINITDTGRLPIDILTMKNVDSAVELAHLASSLIEFYKNNKRAY